MRGGTPAAIPWTSAAAMPRLGLPAARQETGPDARDRPGPRLGEQGRGGLPGAFAGAGHPGGDKPGHDRRRERRAAPLRHAVEAPDLTLVRSRMAFVFARREGVDEIPAWRVHIDPRPEIAERRAAAPVAAERATGDHVGKVAGPAQPPHAPVACR